MAGGKGVTPAVYFAVVCEEKHVNVSGAAICQRCPSGGIAVLYILNCPTHSFGFRRKKRMVATAVVAFIVKFSNI